MEALAQAETGDGAGGGIAGGDAAEGFELAGDLVEVEAGPERVQAGGLAADVGGEEAALQTEDDDAGVQELFELDARDDTDDGVVKRAARLGGWLPLVWLQRGHGWVIRAGFGHAPPPR